MMINCDAVVCKIYLLLFDWTLLFSFWFSVLELGLSSWFSLLFDLDFPLDDCFWFWMLVWISGFLVCIWILGWILIGFSSGF